MGNNKSCCLVAQPSHRGDRERKYLTNDEEGPSYEADADTLESRKVSPQIQHISEREGDDWNVDDPSNHPTAGTIFSERSKPELRPSLNKKCKRYSCYYDNKSKNSSPITGLKKSNSCSTIYIDDSTVSQPNLRNTIKAVALAVYCHIKDRHKHKNGINLNNHSAAEALHLHNLMLADDAAVMGLDPSTIMGGLALNGGGTALPGTTAGQSSVENDHFPPIFDEQLHPLTREPVPIDYNSREPSHRHIYRFMRTLFSTAQLTAECAIVTLVYLERLMTYAEIEVAPSNWKRILLGSILMSSKVWDDQAVWNVDYCQILKDMTVEDMNELERQFLEMVQFNINVPSSVYAKYYFDLRALAEQAEDAPMLEPLNRDKALKLEALSNLYEERIKNSALTLSGLNRSHSLDGGLSAVGSRVVIS